MKYIIRTVKYFLYLTLVLFVILVVLVKLGFVEGSPETMFVNGYDSIWQMALIVAAFAAVYPRFGYSTRTVTAGGGHEDSLLVLKRVMEEHGYLPTEESDGLLVFRKRSPAARILKFGEDRVSVTLTLTGYEIEGITKDIVRLASALEYRLRTPLD